MKEFIKKNFAILLAFALPVVLIIAVALSAYLPSLFLSTDYNFIYTMCTDNNNYYSYRCSEYLQKRYLVVDSKLVLSPVNLKNLNEDDVPDFSNYTDRVFLHDTEKNESREVTIEEVKAMMLNGLLTSPDGVTVSGSYNNSGSFFIFGGGSSSYNHYLAKGRNKSKLNLVGSFDRYSYRDNFQFIGWVLPGRK